MTESIFRSNLLQKNTEKCYEYIFNDLPLNNLVSVINDFLFASVSVINNCKFSIHPVCLMNVVKNFIGEDKNNPSRELLVFFLKYIFQYDFRVNDQKVLDQVIKEGIKETAFMGDLEDACQNQKWNNAESIMAQIYVASDNSRATFDLLIELALQNVPRNGLFVYHILRAYQFQDKKSDNWVFTKTMFDQICNQKLLPPHKRTDVSPEKVYPTILDDDNIIILSAIIRIWNGDYVRINGYKRELSYWLSEIVSNKLSSEKLTQVLEIEKSPTVSYLSIAEKIIKQKKSMNEKAIELINLESIRGLSSLLNPQQVNSLNKKYHKFLV